MKEIEFSTLAAEFWFCLIFTDRRSKVQKAVTLVSEVCKLLRFSNNNGFQRALQSGSLKTLCRLFPEIWLNQVTQVAHVNHDDTYLDKNLAVVASNSPVARRIRVQESTRACELNGKPLKKWQERNVLQRSGHHDRAKVNIFIFIYALVLLVLRLNWFK